MPENPGWEVVLTEEEMMRAARVGCEREIASRLAGMRDTPPVTPAGEGWSVHIEGAAGELALAKLLGRAWDASVNTFKSRADIGRRGEVRTRRDHSWELIVRPTDNPDSYYTLVTGIAPRFVVRGYMLGRHAQRPEWWKNHGGHGHAWFVPQSALIPFPAKTINRRPETDVA